MTKTATKQTNDGAIAPVASPDHSKQLPARKTTKKAQLIRLLERKAGVDVATISAEFSWKAHTARAALSGLRKAGYGIEAVHPKGDKPARYRIRARPEQAAGK